jgi:hypothetical protein
VADSCSGCTLGEEGRKSRITGNSPEDGKRCPTINPPEKAPVSRMSPTKAPRIVLVFLFTKASIMNNENRLKILCRD